MSLVPPSQPPRRRSILTPGQRRLYWAVLILGALLLANTLYLLTNRLADTLGIRALAVAETDLPAFYQAMILSHTGLGVALFVVAMSVVAAHLRRAWIRRHPSSVLSGIGTVVLGVALLVSGLAILREAQKSDHFWVFWVHVGSAAILPVLFGIHRLWSVVPARRPQVLRGAAAMAALWLAAIGAHVISTTVAQRQGMRDDLQAESGERNLAGSRDRDVPLIPEAKFLGAAYVSKDSPFFPSAATTTTGSFLPSRIITRGEKGKDGGADLLTQDLNEFGFAVHALIGATTCQRCHGDIVEQWSKSAHRYASFNNPFYEASVTDMRKAVGNLKSKWCSGCHDPALMLADKMDKEIDRNWAEAQAGLTCLGCHAIDKIHNQTGNGNYNIADEQESPYLFDKSQEGSPVRRFIHDAVLKARPAVHKRMMLKPFFRTGEFCATCHKVNLDVAVNDYRWLRGQNDYDAWHDSGVARNAVRTFYMPPAAKVCQDCHMPLEPATRGDLSAKHGMVRSHRFLGVNTALPFLRGDQDTIARTERFLQDKKLRVEVFALRRGPNFDQPILGLAEQRPALAAGETAHLDVVIRNLGVGHTFPGGTNDSNEGWLELEITDDKGRLLAKSGGIESDGHVDPTAHFFRSIMSDRHGNRIKKRNAQDIFTPVYANVIGPGTADLARYRFEVPEDGVRSVHIRARVMWRKFERHFTEFVFKTNDAMLKRFGGKIPDLPVTEIARHEIVLPVMDAVIPATDVAAAGTASATTPAGAPAGGPATGQAGPPAGPAGAPAGEPGVPAPAKTDDWIRYNDYGIGALLQGETGAADAAFTRVAELAPKNLDGFRNRARVALADGNVPRAYAMLQECEKLGPGDARTAWDWGNTLSEDGEYAKAADAYRRVLVDFPGDRATWRSLGRALYLDGRLDEALEAFLKVLSIDPEDRVAHYHRMLILKAQGKTELAGAAEQAYQKYKLDENAPQVTRDYRLIHPYDNRESLRIHVHDLTRPEEGRAIELNSHAEVPAPSESGS